MENTIRLPNMPNGHTIVLYYQQCCETGTAKLFHNKVFQTFVWIVIPNNDNSKWRTVWLLQDNLDHREWGEAYSRNV